MSAGSIIKKPRSERPLAHGPDHPDVRSWEGRKGRVILMVAIPQPGNKQKVQVLLWIMREVLL